MNVDAKNIPILNANWDFEFRICIQPRGAADAIIRLTPSHRRGRVPMRFVPDGKYHIAASRFGCLAIGTRRRGRAVWSQPITRRTTDYLIARPGLCPEPRFSHGWNTDETLI